MRWAPERGEGGDRGDGGGGGGGDDVGGHGGMVVVVVVLMVVMVHCAGNEICTLTKNRSISPAPVTKSRRCPCACHDKRSPSPKMRTATHRERCLEQHPPRPASLRNRSELQRS